MNPEAKHGENWHAAMRPVKRKALNLNDAAQAIIDELDRVKTRFRAKADHLL